MPASQSDTPYLDALRDFAAARPGAPARARPQGRRGRRLAPDGRDRRAGAGARHPGAHVRHRRGRGADAVRGVAAARRRGLGGAAHVVPGQRGVAGQPRRAADARARGAIAWCSSATRTRAPSTRWCCRGCARPSRRRSSTPTCTSPTACAPETLDARAGGDARRGRARRSCRRPTSARWPTWPRWPRWPTATACRWSWTRRGARTWPSATSCRRHALSLGADLVISSTHKIVGSLTQSAMVHLGTRRPDRRGRGRPLRDARRVDQPERAAGGVARQRPARGGRGRAGAARTRRCAGWRSPARRCARCRGSTCSTSGWSGAPGVFAYDPLRLAIDVRGTLHERLRAGAAAARRRTCTSSWPART